MNSELQSLGRFLLILAIVIGTIGIVLLLAPKLPWFGRLPGDFLIRREHFSFYFPLGTCLFLSIVLSLFFWIIGRFR